MYDTIVVITDSFDSAQACADVLNDSAADPNVVFVIRGTDTGAYEVVRYHVPALVE